MFDEENNQDAALQETIEAAAPLAEDNVDSSEQEEAPLEQKRSDKEENFRALRQKTERIERERDDAIRLAQSLYNAQSQRQAPPAQEPEEEEIRVNDSDFVEGTHLNKVSKKIDQKIKNLESKLKEYERKTEEYSIESRLKSKFPDFDAVVNEDNLKSLRNLDPDVADAILAAPDLYKQGVLAYKMVKKLNVTPNETFEKDRERTLNNAAKPRPTASINSQHGASPLTKANAFANGLTDELRKQLFKEMNEARKAQ